jgi:hypothetical protein
MNKPRLQITINSNLESKTQKMKQFLIDMDCDVIYGKLGDHLMFIPPDGWILFFQAEDIHVDAKSKSLKYFYMKFFQEHPEGICIIERFYRFGEKKQNYIHHCLLNIFKSQRDLFHGFIAPNNPEEVAHTIKTLAKRIQIEDNPPILGRVSKTTTYLWQAQEFLIEGLINCGPKKAQLLLEEFDSPYAIVEAIMKFPERILQIKGFGEKFIESNQNLLKSFYPNNPQF